MYLSSSSLRKLIWEGVRHRNPDGSYRWHQFLSPIPSVERVRFIEGSAYDLTLSRVYEPGLCVGFIPSIGITERQGATVLEIEPDADGWWTFETGKSYLLESVETLTVPEDCFCPIKPRTSVFRAFNQLLFADAHPGYFGLIHGLLTIHHPQGLRLQKGCRFAYLRIARFDSPETDAYEGIYGTDGHGATTNGEKDRAY